MTIFYGARDELDIAAPPRPWESARRLAAVVMGIICGTEFVILLWVLL